MGEGPRRSRAKEYRQERSKAVPQQAVQESIFGGTVALISDQFVCHFTGDEAWPSVEAKVQLVDFNHTHVEVVKGVRVIGYVLEEGSVLLREEFRIAERRGSSITGMIVEINQDWGEFTVKIT